MPNLYVSAICQLSLYWSKKEVDEDFRKNLEIKRNQPYCANHN